MTLMLALEMDGAAFHEGGNADEAARILRTLASALIASGDLDTRNGGKLRDSNGNTVGSWTVTD